MHTRKRSKNKQNEIVYRFMELLMVVKLYHWKTTSYATHKNADSLYSDLNSSIDDYVEVMLGKKDGSRIMQPSFKLNVCNYSKDRDMKAYIQKMKAYLSKMHYKEGDGDLMTIRDDILGHLDKFSYLGSFS